MLDKFCIFSKSGLVLWDHTPGKVSGSPVDELIQTVLIEDRSAEKSYTSGESKMQWTVENARDLVFVVVYQKILTLAYMDSLLESVKEEFCRLFGKQVRAGKGVDFGDHFERLLQEAEFQSFKSVSKPTRQKQFSETSKAKKMIYRADAKDREAEAAKKAEAEEPADESKGGGGDDVKDAAEEEFERMLAARAKMKGKSGQQMRKGAPSPRAAKAAKPSPKGGAKPSKVMATAGVGSRLTKAQKEALDKSEAAGEQDEEAHALKMAAMRKEYIDDDAEDADKEEEWSDEDDGGEEEEGPAKGGGGWLAGTRLGGFLKGLTDGRTVSEADLAPVLQQVRTQLLEKNCASEVVEQLVRELQASLLGRKLDTWTRVSSIVKTTLEESMSRILTPKRSTDVLREVKAARERGRPYVMVFIGVNGVGKSTSLSKVCWYLKNNGCNPMIAACDTFRSGAVEQLKTHADCLGVKLFQKGYAKDPAVVAKEAVEEAAETGHDVVLIDTAGRMQNNKPLMIALTKLISTNEPDLVLFVGEALVGNDGIDQLEMFNQALSDYSGQEHPHTVDGICLTKFDTIDDKVGAALSMVYKTGQPVIFVGTGQKYNNLKKLNVRFVIKSLAG
jgi:signal recognition particle receptor subunit alpha